MRVTDRSIEREREKERERERERESENLFYIVHNGAVKYSSRLLKAVESIPKQLLLHGSSTVRRHTDNIVLEGRQVSAATFQGLECNTTRYVGLKDPKKDTYFDDSLVCRMKSSSQWDVETGIDSRGTENVTTAATTVSMVTGGAASALEQTRLRGKVRTGDWVLESETGVYIGGILGQDSVEVSSPPRSR